MSLTPTNKNNPCPICDNTTGKCRQGREDQDYWQCMSYADARKGEIIGNWKSLGATRDKQWAQFKPDNSREWSEQRQREWQLENQRRNRDLARKDKEAQQKSLCEAERHEQYTQLLAELTLHPDDKADLLRRGFTHKQIELSGFKSAESYQKIRAKFSNLLPGLSADSKNLVIKDAGYLCPIRNVDGLIVACQVRIRSLPTGEEGNRYRWLSGKNQRVHLYPEGCRVEGELPLAVFRPEGKPEGIALAEGTGAKPFLVARRLNQVVIGAAGGQWASSEITFKTTLNKLSEELGGTKEIILHPDAGDVLNQQVMNRWGRVAALLKKWDWKVKFSWWEQITKSSPDIDELEDLSAIQLITHEEFKLWGKREETSKSEPKATEKKQPRLGFNCFKEENPEFEEKIRELQRKLRTLSYPSDILLNERYLPNDLPTQLPKSGLIGLVAPKGSGKSYLLKKVIELAKKEGIPILSITPRIALGREQAIKWEITWIDDYGVMQTRAGDTAKQINELREKRDAAREKLFELEKRISYQLNLLGESEKEKIEQQKANLWIEINQYADQIDNINAASLKTLALCWDSLWRTKERDLKESLIIIDESELGFKHFISGSTCKRSRPQLLKVFKNKIIECLMSGGRVILSDADLTDLPIDYVRKILPIPLKPFIVKNEYIGEKTKYIVDFRTGSRGDTLTDLLESVRSGAYLAITTDSQAEAQALEKRILQELPDDFCPFLDDDGKITKDAQAREKALIVRIDRTTTETEAGRKFIEKPNEQILSWKPRLLIYTPSMGVGVSIDESTKRLDEHLKDIPYFDAVYGLFFGVIEPSQCRQQLSRVRANVPRIVYCKEFNRALEGCASFFPEEIKRQSLKYSHSSLSIIDIAKEIAGYEADDEEIRDEMLRLLKDAWDKESRCWKEPSIDLAAAFKARENYGLWNLANLLTEELEDEGHTVISLKGMKSDLVEQIAEIKDELKMEEATKIAKAPIISVEEAKTILNTLGASKDDELSAQKTLLQDELPGVELTPEFVKKAVVDDRRRWLNRHRLFWYYKNPEIVKQVDTDHWLSSLKKFAEGIPFMRDIRTNAPKAEALRKSKIFEFIDLEDCDRIYEGDTPEAEEFLDQCLEYKDEIQVALNVLVTRKTTPISLANRILGKVGLKLEKLTRSNKDKRWQLSAELVNDPDRLNVLKALELRWQLTQEEAENKKAQKQAEKQSQQQTQPGGQSPVYIEVKVDRPPSYRGGSQGVNDAGIPDPWGEYPEVQNQPLSHPQRATQPGGQSPDYISTKVDCPPNLEDRSQGVSEDVQFCLDALEALEAPGSPSIRSQDEMVSLWGQIEERASECQQELPEDFWVRASVALGNFEEERDSSAEAFGSQSGYEWKELPSVGQMLQWVSGGLEKLVLKAIDSDGSCQVKSLLSGIFTNTYAAQLKPASG